MEENKSTGNLPPGAIYKAAQSPSAWLLTARHLADAAESILRDQLQFEHPYIVAVDDATERARNASLFSEDGAGVAEITSIAPNYLPAQMLYAFAFENLLKGLIVSKLPELTSEVGLHGDLKTHDLVILSIKAGLQLGESQILLFRSLSRIAEWAGRYPTAVKINQHDFQNPESLLDWGSQHPVLRHLFKFISDELEVRLGHPVLKFGSVVVFRPVGVPAAL
jgi:hypothetical protein